MIILSGQLDHQTLRPWIFSTTLRKLNEKLKEKITTGTRNILHQISNTVRNEFYSK